MSPWGRGVSACRPVARCGSTARDVHHGCELGRAKRAQRGRRFEPGTVVCHPGGGSPVWGRLPDEAGRRSRLRTRGFQKLTRVPRGTGHWFGCHRRCVCCQPGRRDSRVVAPLPGCRRHWLAALADRVAGFALGFLALEGVWSAVSLFSLGKTFHGSGGPECDGSGNSPTVSTWRWR